MPTWSEVPAVSTVIPGSTAPTPSQPHGTVSGRDDERQPGGQSGLAGRFRREPPYDLARRHDAGRKRRRHVPQLAQLRRHTAGRDVHEAEEARRGTVDHGCVGLRVGEPQEHVSGRLHHPGNAVDLGRVRTPPPRRLRRQVGRYASELEQPRAGLRHRLVDGRGCASVEPGEVRRDGAAVAADEHEAPHLARDADAGDRARVDAGGERAKGGAGGVDEHLGGLLGESRRRMLEGHGHALLGEQPPVRRERARLRRRGAGVDSYEHGVGHQRILRTRRQLRAAGSVSLVSEGCLCYTGALGGEAGAKEGAAMEDNERESLESRRITRRELLVVGGGAVGAISLAALLAACGGEDEAAAPAEEPAGTEAAPPAAPSATETVPAGGGGEVDTMAWVINSEAVSMDYALAYDFNTNCRDDEHLRAAAALQPGGTARAEPRRVVGAARPDDVRDHSALRRQVPRRHRHDRRGRRLQPQPPPRPGARLLPRDVPRASRGRHGDRRSRGDGEAQRARLGLPLGAGNERRRNHVAGLGRGERRQCRHARRPE